MPQCVLHADLLETSHTHLLMIQNYGEICLSIMNNNYSMKLKPTPSGS